MPKRKQAPLVDDCENEAMKESLRYIGPDHQRDVDLPSRVLMTREHLNEAIRAIALDRMDELFKELEDHFSVMRAFRHCRKRYPMLHWAQPYGTGELIEFSPKIIQERFSAALGEGLADVILDYADYHAQRCVDQDGVGPDRFDPSGLKKVVNKLCETEWFQPSKWLLTTMVSWL